MGSFLIFISAIFSLSLLFSLVSSYLARESLFLFSLHWSIHFVAAFVFPSLTICSLLIRFVRPTIGWSNWRERSERLRKRTPWIPPRVF